MRQILHIDFDSFFASVEQELNSTLRAKPLGVTATNGRTCIIASSREAKKFGIKTGDRTWESLPKCPNLILIPADFNKYFEVSKKFLNIAKDFSPLVELFSIDEVFIDVTDTVHLFGNVQSLVREIKTRIRNEIGEYITVSIGISHNKLLAKLASGANKPNGIFEINKDNFEEVYRKVKLTDLCGIGERIKSRLNKMGIYTILDVRETAENLLIDEFGKVETIFLKNLSQGLDESAVVPYTEAPEAKSIGRNYCLPKNEYDKRVVLQNLFELCEEVGIKLRRLNKKARTIGVCLRGNINVGGRQTYSIYMDSGAEIFRACLDILQVFSHPGGSETTDRISLGDSIVPIKSGLQNDRVSYVRQISVWVSNLENKENIQQSLFDNKRSDRLQATIDNINERFGDHTIRNAFLLYADKLTTVPNGYMADKYERTRLAKV